MKDLRLPLPFHHPERVDIPSGELLVDLRSFVFSGGPLWKRIAARAANDVTWWIDEMPPGELAIVMAKASSMEKSKLVHAGSAERSLASSAPRGLDWMRAVFAESHSRIDEMTSRRTLDAYERERGAKVRALDDLRLFPSFARKSIPADVSSSMSEELARALALHSPQETQRTDGPVLILNPSMQIVRGKELKVWFRIGDEVREKSLNAEDARRLDEMSEALGGVPREAKFEDLVVQGLLLAR